VFLPCSPALGPSLPVAPPVLAHEKVEKNSVNRAAKPKKRRRVSFLDDPL